MLLMPYLEDVIMRNGTTGRPYENSPDHRRALQTQTEPVNANIFGEAHRLQHLGPEHATVTNLNPLVEHRVEGEDLKRGLFSR